MELSEQSKRNISTWFGGRDKGLSSEAMAVTALTGVAPENANYPHDPSDFGRCARLIKRVPEVKIVAFPILSKHGNVWPKLIEAWDEIHETMESESGISWEKSKRAEKTYQVMQRVIYD